MVDVLVDGASQGSILSYPFTVLFGDYTISASFSLPPPTRLRQQTDWEER